MLKNKFIDSMNLFIDTFNKAEQNLLLLVAENSDFDHTKLLQMKGNICGAIFPQVIYKDKNYDDAIIVVDLGKEVDILLSSYDNFKKNKINFNTTNILVFIDSLSVGTTDFLENLYESTSADTNIIGAGAGKITLKQERVLFTKESIIQDGALLLSNISSISTEVRHGWEKIAGPFIANDAKGSLLNSLDYNDAFEVYKTIVEEDSGLLFDENNFFDITKSYPIGISKIDSEILVRDPIAKDKNSLVLLGNISKNSLIYILKGDKEKLIHSAKLATKEAISNVENLEGIIVIDCISRMLFLNDDFEKELQTIKQSVNNDEISMFGILSLGELSSSKHEYIDFYNKTCLIGAY